MDPQAPSQPTLDTAYEHPSNPAQDSSEQADSQSVGASLRRSDPTSERRGPNDQQGEAMPSSLGYGARDASGDAGDKMGGPVSDLEGEQMRAPGEGDIAAAQDHKQGFGEQKDLASDLDRKKADQAKIKESRGMGGGSGGVDVAGAVGGEGKGFVSGGNEGLDSQGGYIQSTHEHV